jgi:hypothetical protein
MESEKKFKTKTGFCHILPDKIVLTRDGVVGNMAKVMLGNNISRILIIYGLIAIALIYLAYKSFLENQTFSAAIYGIISIYLIYGIINSLNNSATPIIERESIKKIKFKKGIVGLTRSRFEVLFQNENGKLKKRLLMLPGSLTGGIKETGLALKIMEEEGLINIR